MEDHMYLQRWIWIPSKISYASPPATSTLTYKEMYKYLHTSVPTLSPTGTVAIKIIDAAGTLYCHSIPKPILHGKYMWVFTYVDSSKTLYNIVEDTDLFSAIYTFNQTIYSPTSIARRSEEKLLMTNTIDFRNNTTSLRLGPYIIHGSVVYLHATRVPIANPISICFPYGVRVDPLDPLDSQASTTFSDETVD